MALYMWFILCLTAGLTGLAGAMTVVFDALFQDWDAVAAFRARLRDYLSGRRYISYVRAEDILLELEKAGGRPPRAVGALDQRREQLKEISDVEARLVTPQPQLI